MGIKQEFINTDIEKVAKKHAKGEDPRKAGSQKNETNQAAILNK